MVLVLFLIFLVLIVIVTLGIVLTSNLSIQLDIKNFKLFKEEKLLKKTNNDYEIFVYGYIFKKIKIFKYKINDIKISKKYFKNIENKIDLSILKSFISSNANASNVKFIEIERLDLNLKLGTENVILTSGIVTASNILISIFLPKLMTNYDKEKYKYEVIPIYENKNKIDLFLESKITIKLLSLMKAIKSYYNAKKLTEKSLKT